MTLVCFWDFYQNLDGQLWSQFFSPMVGVLLIDSHKDCLKCKTKYTKKWIGLMVTKISTM